MHLLKNVWQLGTSRGIGALSGETLGSISLAVGQGDHTTDLRTRRSASCAGTLASPETARTQLPSVESPIRNLTAIEGNRLTASESDAT